METETKLLFCIYIKHDLSSEKENIVKEELPNGRKIYKKTQLKE